jgi:HSP20 family protein
MLVTWGVVPTLDRIFDDVMGSSFGTATNSRTFDAAIDVHASETEVVFICDVPGVKREDLDVTLENRVLTINGTRKFDSRDNEQVMLGRAYGAFRRAYTLPDSCNDENLSASVADGVLTIRISKHAKPPPRKIPIGAGADAQRLNG